MVLQIIKAFPKERKIARQDGSKILYISENFADTVQGENFVGYPSVFLRLKNCVLNCDFCDSTEVWRRGNPYSVDELLDLWKEKKIINRFYEGNQHLVLTGGSPLLQQNSLIELLDKMKNKYNKPPFIEIENECVIMPKKELSDYVNLWNNSPKLKNSGVKEQFRYKPEVLKYLSSLENSYFKFVISSEKDWKEIDKYFLKTNLIKKEQIVLMPEGVTRVELQNHYQTVINLAIKQGIRITDRLHITIWNKAIGV